MIESIKPWEGYFPPFQIWGNLYFVGTIPASTHVVDTGEGLILFDSGYQHSLYLVLDGMYRLGLKPENIKYIFHTHGHIDHMGATRALQELTGAKALIGWQDREYANGMKELSYARELEMKYTEIFEPDILLKDGDKIVLGNTSVRAVATPGHTPGAMSYIFDVSDGRETYTAGLHGGMGLNTMCREFLDKYGLSHECREQFLDAMERLKKESVDIFLGNHMQHNHTEDKYYAKLNGCEKAFIVPGEWQENAKQASLAVKRMMEKENETAV